MEFEYSNPPRPPHPHVMKINTHTGGSSQLHQGRNTGRKPQGKRSCRPAAPSPSCARSYAAPHLPTPDSHRAAGHKHRKQDPGPSGSSWATQPAPREKALLQLNAASHCFQCRRRQSAAKAVMTSLASCQEAMWNVTLGINTYWHPAPTMSACPSSCWALFSQMYQALSHFRS